MLNNLKLTIITTLAIALTQVGPALSQTPLVDIKQGDFSKRDNRRRILMN